MKISIKTLIIIAVLGTAISLSCLIAALCIHMNDVPYNTEGESTPSEMSDLSEDFLDITTVSPETILEESESVTETDSGTTDAEATVKETTVEEMTILETTVETPVDTTEEFTETEPETTEETTEEIKETEAQTTEETTEEITEPETTAHIHAYSAWKIEKEPSCEKEGLNSRTCECGETEYLNVSAIGHKPKSISAVSATCLSTGLSEGSICSVCKEILKKQIIIPKTKCKFDRNFCIYCNQLDNSAVKISAPYAGLYKADTLECIYSLSADMKTSPASLTKMITACVAIENMPLDHIITVGSEQELVPENSSLCFIYKGNRITLYDLLTGMLLCSGNDAAYTVAVNVARYVTNDKKMSDVDAVNYFCDLMNDYSRKIGAENTCFKTPDGFDADGQFSTVHDLAIITAHAMKNQTIAKIVSKHRAKVVFESGELGNWTNTNELINPNSKYYVKEATGFKTGGTVEAGKCLSATFEINGTKYIAVVMGCEDNDARYKNILEFINIFK